MVRAGMSISNEYPQPSPRAAKRDRPERSPRPQGRGQSRPCSLPLTKRPDVQALPGTGFREAVQSRKEIKRGDEMRDAIMAVLAVLVGVAVAAIPLLPVLFCGAE